MASELRFAKNIEGQSLGNSYIIAKNIQGHVRAQMYAYIVGAEGDSAENRAQNRALSRAQSLFIPTLTNANILQRRSSLVNTNFYEYFVNCRK